MTQIVIVLFTCISDDITTEYSLQFAILFTGISDKSFELYIPCNLPGDMYTIGYTQEICFVFLFVCKC